jgi:hypothetical protein
VCAFLPNRKGLLCRFPVGANVLVLDGSMPAVPCQRAWLWGQVAPVEHDLERVLARPHNEDAQPRAWSLESGPPALPLPPLRHDGRDDQSPPKLYAEFWVTASKTSETTSARVMSAT